MTNLEGKVVIVTGAARGQGAAEAKLLVESGAKVMLADVLDDEGAATAAELGEHACYQHLDVSSEADWAAGLPALESRWGRLDGLLNNAGILVVAPISDTSVDDFMKVVAVDQLGVFLGMKECAPVMARTGGGAIVNTASITASYGVGMMVAYAGAKNAVLAMTRVAALEFGALNIRVNAISPGLIDTAIAESAPEAAQEVARSVSAAFPISRQGSSDEVAHMAAFLLSDESEYCTGANFTIDGGWTAGMRMG